MMQEKMQQETKKSIKQARANGNKKESNQLWEEFYNKEVPTPAQFADCYQAILFEEKEAEEAKEAEAKPETKPEPDKKK